MSDQVAIALAYSLPPTAVSLILGLANIYHLRHLRHAMNSLLDQRVANAQKIGYAEGRQAERRHGEGGK